MDVRREHLRNRIEAAERAYRRLYDGYADRYATDAYREMRDAFVDAARLAGELGLGETAAALEQRRAHCRTVFLSQWVPLDARPD